MYAGSSLPRTAPVGVDRDLGDGRGRARAREVRPDEVPQAPEDRAGRDTRTSAAAGGSGPRRSCPRRRRSAGDPPRPGTPAAGCPAPPPSGSSPRPGRPVRRRPSRPAPSARSRVRRPFPACAARPRRPAGPGPRRTRGRRPSSRRARTSPARAPGPGPCRLRPRRSPAASRLWRLSTTPSGPRSYAWLFARLPTSTPASRIAGSAAGVPWKLNSLESCAPSSVTGHSTFTTVRSSRRNSPPRPDHAYPYPCDAYVEM